MRAIERMVVLSVLASLLVFGCGGGGRKSPTAPEVELQVTIQVLGESGQPLPEATVMRNADNLGVTDSRGILVTTLTEGARILVTKFGYADQSLNVSAATVTVNMKAADDIAITRIYGESDGQEIREGSVIRYPTDLVIEGTYRAVSYSWPAQGTFTFNFVSDSGRPFSGSVHGNQSRALSQDRWQMRIPKFEPCLITCTATNGGVECKCEVYFDRSDAVEARLGEPIPGGSGSANVLKTKTLRWKNTFQRK